MNGFQKTGLRYGLNQVKLKVLSCLIENGLRENVLCWILLGGMFVDKLLGIKHNKLKFSLSSNSSLIENPIPILWNCDGVYGWVPVEIVKNETQAYKIRQKLKHSFNSLNFTWQQAYRLRPDVGKMLESLTQSNN